MAFFTGILAVLMAAMLLVATLPMALMACGFISDSGECSSQKFWTVFWGIVLLFVIPATALAAWGWSQLS